MRFDVITVGGAVIDSFLDTGRDEIHGKIVYPMEGKFLLKNIWFSTGGGGTNTAVSFSRMGLKTGFLGKLGDDENGNIILRELKKEKVEFIGIHGKEPTGYSIILDSKEHNRTILVYKGANNYLKFSEIKLNRLNTKWIYFSAMEDESLKMQNKLAEWAARKKIMIAYNPASYVTRGGVRKVRAILKNCHILVLNDGEARDLVGKGNWFKGLHKLGPKIVCVTKGKDGAEVSDGKKVYLVGVHNIKVKERTGAGDAFASGFVTGFIKTGNVEKAIQIGAANSESVIRLRGAKKGLMKWNEVIRRVKKSPVKIELFC